jgi:hypothetical protein
MRTIVKRLLRFFFPFSKRRSLKLYSYTR